MANKYLLNTKNNIFPFGAQESSDFFIGFVLLNFLFCVKFFFFVDRCWSFSLFCFHIVLYVLFQFTVSGHSFVIVKLVCSIWTFSDSYILLAAVCGVCITHISYFLWSIFLIMLHFQQSHYKWLEFFFFCWTVLFKI